MKTNAQGTIEYLVIIGVVVIIALVTVSLLTGFFDTGTGVATTTQRLQQQTNPVNVADAIVIPEGELFLEINSLETDTVTINRIIIGDSEEHYISNNSLPRGSKGYFSTIVDTDCSIGGYVTKDLTIEYTTRYGLTRTERIENIRIPCEEFTVSTTNIAQNCSGDYYYHQIYGCILA